VCAQHAEWGAAFQAGVEPLPPLSPRARSPRVAGGAPRPLRVGYISPDLFTHSVSYFAEAPLAGHSPGSVALTVYDSTPRRDAKSAALRARAEAAGGVWRCVEGLSDERVAALVREDEIDVLVELTGGWRGGAGGGAQPEPGGWSGPASGLGHCHSFPHPWRLKPPPAYLSPTFPQATPRTTGWA
jgi:nucleotide-binding universal stress UspA family protein